MGWRRHTWVALLLLGAVSSVPHATGASSSSVVSASVPTATSLDPAGCAAGVAGQTSFGTVMPATSVVTATDCSITFGSSNGSARLLLSQTDRTGLAMTQPSVGTSDPAFGSGGVATSSTAPGSNFDYVQGVAMHPDGSLLIAGACDMGTAATGQDGCLTQLLPDGTPDPAFGTGGRVTTAVASGAGRDYWFGVELLDGGGSVTAGLCESPTTSWDMCVTRYDAAGTRVPGFGSGGTTVVPMSNGTGADFARALVVQPDGRTVAVGECQQGTTNLDFCAFRLDANGSLDGSFAGGRASQPFAQADLVERPYAVAMAGNRDLLLVGSCDTGGASGRDACILRLDEFGRPVATFGSGGRVVTAIAPGSGADEMRAVAIQPDGKVVIAGYCDMGLATAADFCLARYSASGALDTSFDGDGLVTTAIGPGAGVDHAHDVEVQGDGSIVVGGQCDTGGTSGTALCIVRYRSDGTLDAAFAAGGVKLVDVAPGAAADWGRALSIGDGRIVLAGHCDFGSTATGWDTCVVQLARGGAMGQYADPANGWSSAATSHFAVCLRAITGASASWTTNATCSMTDGAHWRAAPALTSTVATSAPLEPAAVASFRFGLRTAAAQPPGAYTAPITFMALAP